MGHLGFLSFVNEDTFGALLCMHMVYITRSLIRYSVADKAKRAICEGCARDHPDWAMDNPDGVSKGICRQIQAG